MGKIYTTKTSSHQTQFSTPAKSHASATWYGCCTSPSCTAIDAVTAPATGTNAACTAYAATTYAIPTNAATPDAAPTPDAHASTYARGTSPSRRPSYDVNYAHVTTQYGDALRWTADLGTSRNWKRPSESLPPSKPTANGAKRPSLVGRTHDATKTA